MTIITESLLYNVLENRRLCFHITSNKKNPRSFHPTVVLNPKLKNNFATFLDILNKNFFTFRALKNINNNYTCASFETESSSDWI